MGVRDRDCSGLTLVELLVTLGVMTLLLALMLPAVQSARESARSVQCKDHLHQIGVATHDFHSSQGRLPFALTPLRELLPGVDATQVYLWLKTPAAEKWLPVPRTPPVYLCPSDPFANGADMLKISYFINGGSAMSPQNGVWDPNPVPTRTLRDLTDGLSSTALFAEKLVWRKNYSADPLEQARRSPLRYVWRTKTTFEPGQEDELAAFCLDVANRSVAEYGWSLGLDDLVTEGARYNHIIPPNNWSFSNGYDPTSGPFPATSLHRGGANVLMADGAAKFVSSQIDMQVWRSVGSRANGDVVGEF